MKTLSAFAGAALLSATALRAQTAFTNSSSLMSLSTSGGCMGVVDMNGDGRDDILKLNNSKTLVIDYQNHDGTFTTVSYGNMSTASQWGFAAADIDEDGHKDVISGGSYDGVHYRRISAIGQSTITDLNNGSLFTQCVNVADINNDGANDYWSCHDDGAPRQWLNNGSGDLSYASIIDYTTVPASDMSGNYGSVWTDFDNDGDLDLYIAKCRQGVNNPDDPRRWNRLFVNDGSNQYADLAADYGIQVRNQSWTADFGDIDNDGDLDLVITNHDANIQLFENDGTGHFTEISEGSGLDFGGFMLQSKFVDFDNDGYLDLLIAGGVEYYFRNNGNRTFSRILGLFPSNKAMHSFATGDLNNDGFPDVFANYGGGYVNPDSNNPDRLWLNNGNGNHWFGVRLQGTASNRDAIGARVTITSASGTQIRDVRSGDGFRYMSFIGAHFGLGADTEVMDVTIRWPNCTTETFKGLAINTAHTIVQGITTAVQEPSAGGFSVWPSPVLDELRYTGAAPAAAFEIIDARGRVALAGRAEGGRIAVAGLGAGPYMLRMTEPQGTKTARFLKE
ncbi:MAG: FG-GAP-like repeat-containing protein [Flavobacteriales bacterium]